MILVNLGYKKMIHAVMDVWRPFLEKLYCKILDKIVGTNIAEGIYSY